MCNSLQFSWHLATSSPDNKSSTFATTKNHYIFSPNQRILHPSNTKLKFHAKHVLVRANIDLEDQSDVSDESAGPQKRNFFDWKKLAVGILLSLLLPSYRHRMGPFVILKSKLETVLETVEITAEVVEDLAEVVEKLADEAGKRLPEDSKLKDTLEKIEDLAEQADAKAEKAQQLIHQVEENIEEMMEARISDVTHIDRRDEEEKRLVEDLELKDTAEKIENLAEQADVEAEKAHQLVHKVEDNIKEIMADTRISDVTNMDQVEKRLPEDSMVNNTAEKIETLAEQADAKDEKAQQLIPQADENNEETEDARIPDVTSIDHRHETKNRGDDGPQASTVDTKQDIIRIQR